jgi:hypothetical protein
MYFEFIYLLGKKFKFFPKIKSLDRKFALVEFPFSSSEVLSGSTIVLFVSVILSLVFFALIPFFGYVFLLGGLIASFSAYVFASGIFPAQRTIELKNQMLEALLQMSNYISLNSSFESAFFNAGNSLTGTLRKQFDDIKAKIEKKEFNTLGEAFEEYIPVWMELNPSFVKGLNLLQTASIALEEDKEKIIEEVIETVLQEYYASGKRSTETLSNQTSSLLSIGVMMPLMSLILLPLITIFLPNVSNLMFLAFFYNVLVPALLLLMAMNFAQNRVQVSGINLPESPKYRPMPKMFMVLSVLIALVLLIPLVLHLTSINLSSSETIAREFALSSIFNVWVGLFGVVVAVELFLFVYVKMNERLWNEINEMEKDLPHLLQSISSYLSLNRSLESVIKDIIEDYRSHGFGKHPTVKMLSFIKNSLFNLKKGIHKIICEDLRGIVASKKISEVLMRISVFTNLDQKSAAKSARMVRNQQLNVFKLDEYIRTLLAETVSVVTISVNVLAPLLSSTAIIMSIAIVMSLEFIKKQINNILLSIGSAPTELQLVNLESIIPPTSLMVIVGFFFLEITIILSVFLSNIKFGTDKFQIAKTIMQSLFSAFLIFSVLLFFGHILFTEIVFKGVTIGGAS